MSTAVIRFEVLLPNVDGTSTTGIAVTQFITNMITIAKSFDYQSNSSATGVDYFTVFGYIVAAQAATALGYLTTLNSSIDAAYSPVLAASWNATSQP